MNQTTSQGVESGRLISQPIQVSPNYLPINTYNLVMTPQWKQYQNVIISLLIEFIQQNAQKNQTRAILYNWMSVANWNNAQFIELCNYVNCNVILTASRATGASPEQIIQSAVIESVDHYLGRVLMDNQYLERNLNTDQVYELRKHYNAFNNNMPLINDVFNRMNNQPMMGQQQVQQPIVQSPYQSYGQQQQQQQPVQQGSSSGLYRMVNSNHTAGQPNGNASSSSSIDRYGDDYVVNRVQPEVDQQQNYGTHHRNIAEANRVSQDSWKPTEDYPYLYATNNERVIVLEKHGDNILPIAKIKKDMEMEKSAHFLEKGDLNTTASVVNHDESMIRQNSLITEIKPVEISLNISESNKGVAENSIKYSAFFADMALRSMQKKDQTTNIFRCNGILIDMVACDKDANKLGDILVVCDSFSQAVQAMQSNKNNIINGTSDNSDEISFNFFNRRLTDSVNDFTKKTLGLPQGWIDSFVDDAAGLLPFIFKEYGPKFADAITEAQHRIIIRAVDVARDELKATLDEDYMSGLPEGDRPVTVYVNNEFTLSAVNVFSSELELNIPKVNVVDGLGTAIIEKATPLFYRILRSALDYSVGLNGFHTTYIKTLDNVYFEAHQGAIDPSVIMVTKVTP